MKKLVIVSPHFIPSNLVSAHRARLWAQYLPEFGWEPVIVTTNPQYYEEMVEPDLLRLLNPELRVIHTRAFPVKPLRLIGDIGVRAFYWHYQTLCKLAETGEMDFLHITIPSNYSAPLGRLIQQKYRIPYGIDYQDPWINRWPGTEIMFSKHWISYYLSTVLEPWSVKSASLITGISDAHYSGVLERNPHLDSQVVFKAMPFGCSERDFEIMQQSGRTAFLFDPGDQYFHMIYAGVMWPNAYSVLERLFAALNVMARVRPQIVERFRLHFVGTAARADVAPCYSILDQARRFGVEKFISEHPARIGYIDVLNHLTKSSAILILGSTDAHYSPSKVYQSVQALRPLFAMLHQDSTAIDVIRQTRAGTVVTFSSDTLPDTEMLAHTLGEFIEHAGQFPGTEIESVLEKYSARHSARVLVESVEQALAKAGT